MSDCYNLLYLLRNNILSHFILNISTIGLYVSSRFHQTSTTQILAYKWYPYGLNLSIRQTFLPTTFNLAIRQTLTLPKHSHCTVVDLAIV